MQLRQCPPDVIRDVVVRFVERVLYEIFYAHYALTKKVNSENQEQEAAARASFAWSHVDQKQKESRRFNLPAHSREQADIGALKS